jgi:hypothetical protein
MTSIRSRRPKRPVSDVAKEMNPPLGLADAGALTIAGVEEVVGRAARRVADAGRHVADSARQLASTRRHVADSGHKVGKAQRKVAASGRSLAQSQRKVKAARPAGKRKPARRPAPSRS